MNTLYNYEGLISKKSLNKDLIKSLSIDYYTKIRFKDFNNKILTIEYINNQYIVCFGNNPIYATKRLIDLKKYISRNRMR